MACRAAFLALMLVTFVDFMLVGIAHRHTTGVLAAASFAKTSVVHRAGMELCQTRSDSRGGRFETRHSNAS